jgi:chromosome segregation ATPase
VSGARPTPIEAGQLHRLRTLRVQRARERCGQARGEVDEALQAVRRRQQQIEHSRRAIDTLANDIVHALAPRLPRWSSTIAAQRDYLADRLERDEYALINDEQQLEEAQERLQQARAQLTRALAREDAVRGLADQTRHEFALAHERRTELELEDQARVGAKR